jgi:hypothetical protein
MQNLVKTEKRLGQFIVHGGSYMVRKMVEDNQQLEGDPDHELPSSRVGKGCSNACLL